MWIPKKEMPLGLWLSRLDKGIKSSAQKLSQSVCWPYQSLTSLWIWNSLQTLLNLSPATSIFEKQLSRAVTHWVQRNLSPTASLQFYANCLWAKWKEKTPHQRTSEALLFNLNMPASNVGGRTTLLCDILTLLFAHYENIYLKYKNIFAFLIIIAMLLL